MTDITADYLWNGIPVQFVRSRGLRDDAGQRVEFAEVLVMRADGGTETQFAPFSQLKPMKESAS